MGGIPDVKIRVGTLADLEPMMELGLMACRENSVGTTNPTKLLYDIYPSLQLDHGLVGIIGNPGEQIEAAILLRIGTMQYSDEPSLEERAIFVHPDFRAAKGGRAAHLCKFAMRTSDQLGIPLAIGVLSNERTAAKVRMYSRILGEPTGAYWLYNCRTGGHEVVGEEAMAA